MLQSMRDNVQGLMAKVIVGLIVLTFALFGVDSLVGGGGPAAVADVNGVEISEGQLQQSIAMQKNILMNRMGDNVDPALLDDQVLRKPVLDNLINKTLQLQAADSNAMVVSAAMVDQLIISMPQFQDAGQFSPQLYQNILRSNGYTLTYFKQSVAEDMLLQQLNQGFAGSDFITSQELQAIAAILAEKRSFDYLVLPQASVLDQVQLSDHQIEAYYSENSQQFETPEQVKLNYINLDKSQFFAAVSEQELQEAYQLEVADYQSAEERRVSHILLEINDQVSAERALKEISAIKARINAGEDFAALAAEFSSDTGSSAVGGDLGYTTGDTYPERFEEALFALPLNQVSEPVLTESGYHLIKATEITGNSPPSFEERREVLTAQLRSSAAEAEFVSIVENLRDLSFNASDLQEPASDLNLQVQASDWLDPGSATGLLADQRIMAAAFSSELLEHKNNSEVIEISPDQYVVVRIAEHKASSVKPLADVKPAIVAALTRAEANAILLKQANGLLTEIESAVSGSPLPSVESTEWHKEEGLRRNSPGANPEILAAVFSLGAVEGSAKAQTMTTGDVLVVLLDNAAAGSLSDLSRPEQQAIANQLEQLRSGNTATTFVDSLREHASVNIL